MPAGNTFVSATITKGSCTGGAILNCTIGPMAAGESVTITLVTKPSAIGLQTNTVTVGGDRPETNTGNNSATATVEVVGTPTPPHALRRGQQGDPEAAVRRPQDRRSRST